MTVRVSMQWLGLIDTATPAERCTDASRNWSRTVRFSSVAGRNGHGLLNKHLAWNLQPPMKR